MTSGYPNSFYAERLAGARTRAPLTSEQVCQVAVIGGGLAGLSTAKTLAEGGAKVILLEAARVGFGASGRNGGFVLPGYAMGQEAIAEKVGQQAAAALQALSAEGVEIVRRNIAAAKRPDIVHGKGDLSLWRHPAKEEAKRAQARMGGALYEGDALHALVKSARYHIGLLRPDAGFHIDPLAYCHALAGLAEAAGAVIHEGSKARSLVRRGTNWEIETDEGSLLAEQVMLATSGYGPRSVSGVSLWPRLEMAVLPVSTYIVALEPTPEILEEVLAFTGSLHDTRRALDYYRTVDNGGPNRRLLWGGRISTRRSLPPQLSQEMRGDMLTVFPELAEARVTHAWGGLMGYARHWMPIIGQLDEGLWTATAFGGHGLNTTAMAGRLIADAILSGDDEWRRFAPWGPAYAGGIVGRAMTQVIYWRMQAQDRKEERL